MATRRFFPTLVTTLALLVALLAQLQPAHAQTFISNGQLATLSATGCVIIRTQRQGAAAFALSGTWTGTVNFEVNPRDSAAVASCASNNGWVAKTFATSTGGTAVSSATSNGTWDGSVGGYSLLRLRFTHSSGQLEVVIGTGQGGGTGGSSGGGGSFDGVLKTPNADSAMDETNDAARVNIVAGSTAGPTDTDDGSIAGAQTPALVAAQQNAWDGSVWRRVTFGTAGSASAQVTTVQGIASMTPLLVTASATNLDVQIGGSDSLTIGTFPDNEPFNLAQVAGTTIATNAGTATAGTPRVVIGSDQAGFGGAAAALADDTANPTVPNVGAFNSIWNGTTWDRAPGTAALGATVNTEAPAPAALSDTMSNPTAPLLGAAMTSWNATTSQWQRLQVPIAACDDPNLVSSVPINVSTSGNNELVALTSTQTVFVCGYDVQAGGTVGVQFIYGTGTACATGETDITGVYDLQAREGLVRSNGGAVQFKGAVSNALCIELSASVSVQGVLTYIKRVP